MSKLCVLALLFYNIIIISCIPLENENTYTDRGDEAKFNLLELFKVFDEKSRENRRDVTENSLENWTGRWMPDRAGDPTPPPKVSPATDSPHRHSDRLPMGKVAKCDDGKTNLTLDWDNSPVNYTCYGPKIIPNLAINPLLYSETIPHAYSAPHRCMNESIKYQDVIPLYGPHRPVYPIYGEYKFIPRERWLHSLEHGAVVMLYHPCANPLEIQRLKALVTDCLRRHIISPYNLIDEERPLVLVTWGSRLSMSQVNTEIVKNFIREKALKGAEKIPYDGDFNEGLLTESQIVSNYDDTNLCPNIQEIKALTSYRVRNSIKFCIYYSPCI